MAQENLRKSFFKMLVKLTLGKQSKRAAFTLSLKCKIESFLGTYFLCHIYSFGTYSNTFCIRLSLSSHLSFSWSVKAILYLKFSLIFPAGALLQFRMKTLDQWFSTFFRCRHIFWEEKLPTHLVSKLKTNAKLLVHW